MRNEQVKSEPWRNKPECFYMEANPETYAITTYVLWLCCLMLLVHMPGHSRYKKAETESTKYFACNLLAYLNQIKFKNRTSKQILI